MSDPIEKEDLKKIFTETLEPFAGAIKEDFNRVDERFNKVDERFEKIETTLIAAVEDLKEARKERQVLEKRINDTYSEADFDISNLRFAIMQWMVLLKWLIN